MTTPEPESASRTRGRPRDPAIDDAALTAARELLVEVGWDQLSMVAIAERAQVGRPALYRRWPSKTHLVFEAVFGWRNAPSPVVDAEDSADWVQRSFAYTRTLFSRPEVKAALPGLLAALRDRPELQAALWKEFGAPGVSLLADTLRTEGDPDAALDAQATMILIIGATMITELLVPPNPALTARLPHLLHPTSTQDRPGGS